MTTHTYRDLHAHTYTKKEREEGTGKVEGKKADEKEKENYQDVGLELFTCQENNSHVGEKGEQTGISTGCRGLVSLAERSD